MKLKALLPLTLSSVLLCMAAVAQAETATTDPNASTGTTEVDVVTVGSTPVAGSSLTSVAVTELQTVITGWSVKESILGKHVVNEKGEKVGKIEDLIIAPDTYLSYAIVGAGGFLDLGKHDVAISVRFFKVQDGKDLVLEGATKDLLKQMPEFKYSKN